MNCSHLDDNKYLEEGNIAIDLQNIEANTNDGATLNVKLFYTVCPRNSDTFYLVSYYIKWVTTSWTYCNLTMMCPSMDPLDPCVPVKMSFNICFYSLDLGRISAIYRLRAP